MSLYISTWIVYLCSGIYSSTKGKGSANEPCATGKQLISVTALSLTFKNCGPSLLNTLRKETASQTITQQVIWPWSCHQSLQQRAVWGIGRNLAVDEAIMWLYSCALEYDSTMKALWPIGRDYTLLALCFAEWTSWLSSKALPQGLVGLLQE